MGIFMILYIWRTLSELVSLENKTGTCTYMADSQSSKLSADPFTVLNI